MLTTTSLVILYHLSIYIILELHIYIYGKGSSDWFWSTWDRLVSFLLKCLYMFVAFQFFFVLLLFLYIIVEWWRTTPSVSCKVSMALNHFLTCLLLLYTTHINTCHVLLLLVTVPIVESAIASFKELLGSSCTGEHYQPNDMLWERVTASASLNLVAVTQENITNQTTCYGRGSLLQLLWTW